MTVGRVAPGRSLPDAASVYQRASLTDIAYLAGMIDGEGTIGLGRRWHRRRGHRIPYVKVVNTHRGVIDWCFEHFGGHPRHMIERGKYKPCWGWEMSGLKSTRALLNRVRPFLKVKAQHADLIEDYWQTGDFRGGATGSRPLTPEVIERREEIANALTGLNGGPRPYAKKNRFLHTGIDAIHAHERNMADLHAQPGQARQYFEA